MNDTAKPKIWVPGDWNALFGFGTNRLYVHRGTGFYGFPLRVGVPGEASVLEVLVAAAES